ncbi:hypothetical protein M2650_04170 [Luteimonas sp. SX5]|uniref:Uncharacterized protein n=1 Tax=Luteimonas galliterrae TaxID=2940486 RepID=A0ABT0MG33_9GAMM|nr:hypothetical protein [Luteimonas galliterrae]MCL1633839.1 hypothetical protein [Luteimonas galliterrae]
MSAVPKPHVILNPRLSARNAAKYFLLPGADQIRLLRDQKFPRLEPQVFKQPYYAISKRGIRAFLERGPESLVDTRAQIQRMRNAPQRMHLTRVLGEFLNSEHAQRGLKPISFPRCQAYIRNLELRLSPDLVAYEGKEERFIYFNEKAEQCSPEVARITLEIAYWILKQNGVELKPQQLEYIDLFTGVLYRGRKPRKKTMQDLEENARLIESLWPTIEP